MNELPWYLEDETPERVFRRLQRASAMERLLLHLRIFNVLVAGLMLAAFIAGAATFRSWSSYLGVAGLVAAFAAGRMARRWNAETAERLFEDYQLLENIHSAASTRILAEREAAVRKDQS